MHQSDRVFPHEGEYLNYLTIFQKSANRKSANKSELLKGFQFVNLHLKNPFFSKIIFMRIFQMGESSQQRDYEIQKSLMPKKWRIWKSELDLKFFVNIFKKKSSSQTYNKTSHFRSEVQSEVRSEVQSEVRSEVQSGTRSDV